MHATVIVITIRITLRLLSATVWVGQLWDVKLEVLYNATASDHISPGPAHYAITVTIPPGDTKRIFACMAAPALGIYI